MLFSMMRIGFNLKKRPEIDPNFALYSMWKEVCGTLQKLPVLW